jgi:hypothetical protein
MYDTGEPTSQNTALSYASLGDDDDDDDDDDVDDYDDDDVDYDDDDDNYIAKYSSKVCAIGALYMYIYVYIFICI